MTYSTSRDLVPEPRSMGGDLNVSRRCFRGDHINCKGSWTAYPDQAGPCECPDVDCPCHPEPAAAESRGLEHNHGFGTQCPTRCPAFGRNVPDRLGPAVVDASRKTGSVA